MTPTTIQLTPMQYGIVKRIMSTPIIAQRKTTLHADQRWTFPGTPDFRDDVEFEIARMDFTRDRRDRTAANSIVNKITQAIGGI